MANACIVMLDVTSQRVMASGSVAIPAGQTVSPACKVLVTFTTGTLGKTSSPIFSTTCPRAGSRATATLGGADQWAVTGVPITDVMAQICVSNTGTSPNPQDCAYSGELSNIQTDAPGPAGARAHVQ